ncbi:hypothetical protein [Candidatus Nitrospira neomarina]|uniref:Uncharacterized protein n=1 Tax=Candidatus Nitrospira neomarina TaxID=3020899 RepID=A0AA96GGN8_9BACT|nr:hypothetical protein [Candidatus Nitrospira neomarina]WNM61476.1 hypothetical protein PQG83_17205 [Candidatus Nitrospira neomarina]
MALWRGQVVLPTSKEGAHCLSIASLRAAGVGNTAQGTRRATPRPPWFWVLLPKQKDLVRRTKAGTKRYQEGAGSIFWIQATLAQEPGIGAATAGPAQMVSI